MADRSSYGGRLRRHEPKSAGYEGVEVFRNGVSLPCLLIPYRSPTIRKSAISGGGNHGCCPVEESRVWLDACDRAVGFDVACGERGLHARAAGGLQRRCVSSLQCRHSRRRPRHGLHGPQAGSTLAGLPGVFQTVRVRTRGQGGDASQHQAGGFAKACQRKTVSAKTTCPSWSDLTVLIPARQNLASSPICGCSVATARAGIMRNRSRQPNPATRIPSDGDGAGRALVHSFSEQASRSELDRSFPASCFGGPTDSFCSPTA